MRGGLKGGRLKVRNPCRRCYVQLDTMVETVGESNAVMEQVRTRKSPWHWFKYLSFEVVNPLITCTKIIMAIGANSNALKLTFLNTFSPIFISQCWKYYCRLRFSSAPSLIFILKIVNVYSRYYVYNVLVSFLVHS